MICYLTEERQAQTSWVPMSAVRVLLSALTTGAQTISALLSLEALMRAAEQKPCRCWNAVTSSHDLALPVG